MKGDSFEGLVRERLREARLFGESHNILGSKMTENMAFDTDTSLIYRLNGIDVNRPLKVGETIQLPTDAARLFAISAQYPYSLAGGALAHVKRAQLD